jgi:two-component system phosphate regulon response regulator PhoB
VATVLVIEDDAGIRELVATALRAAGHDARTAARAEEGLRALHEDGVDLVILDLVLPDLSGSATLERIKSDPATAQVPIIILSGRADEADRVNGLEAGAEDYVTKPFSVRELLLRVKIALRRHDAEGPARTAGPLRIDMEAHRAYVDETELSLTPIEFRLLCTLAARPGRAQSRRALLAEVWGLGPNLETRTVDTHVKRLREKLGPAAEWVETVRGIGYRFVDPEHRGPSRDVVGH